LLLQVHGLCVVCGHLGWPVGSLLQVSDVLRWLDAVCITKFVLAVSNARAGLIKW
jgi:hypothetical protein